MDWNVYVGTDVFAVVQGLLIVDEAVDQVVDSDINARALTIAAHIDLLKPDVVFLQEAWQMALLECTDFPDPDSCTVVSAYDFLAVFEAVLVNYDVAGVQELTQLTIPYSSGYVHVMDRNVILVRKGVVIPAGGATDYTPDPELYSIGNLYHVTVDSTEIYSLRGYITVPVEIHGNPYLLATTHLEVFYPYREAQAMELASVLGGLTEKVMLGGDINDEPGSATYNALTDEGFIDRWNGRYIGRWDDGFTCCQDADLLNRISALDEQIDFVFTLNADFQTISGRVIGDEWYDKTLTIPRLWPSDHGGLIFTLYRH